MSMKIQKSGLKDAFWAVANGIIVGGAVLAISRTFNDDPVPAAVAGPTGLLALWIAAQSARELAVSVSFCAVTACGGAEYLNRQEPLAPVRAPGPSASPAQMPAAGQRLF